MSKAKALSNKALSNKISRRDILSPFVLTIVVAFLLMAGLEAIYPFIKDNTFINGIGDTMNNQASGSVLGYLEYLIFDISQFTFLFSPLATVGMFVFAYLGAYLERSGSKYMGTGVDGNGHIYNSILVYSIIFTLIGELIYGKSLASFGFVPTLATYLLFQHFVMYYGVSTKKIMTIGITTTLLATPCCLLTRMTIVDTLGMPIFISIATGAILCVPLCHMIFKPMKWMTPRNRNLEPQIKKIKTSKFVWFINQLLGDVGQLGVSGSSISSIGLIVFAIISYCLNPLSTGLGNNLLPITLFTILVTGALTIFIFYPYYEKMPVLSFGSMVTVGAFMVTYPTSPLIVALSIIYSAIVPVLITAWVFKISNYKGDYCVLPIVMFSITMAVVPFALFIRLVLVPMGL